MTFIDLKGRKKSVKTPNKYLIDWDGKSLSKFQKAAKDFLRPYWRGMYVFEEFPLVGTRQHFDIFNATQRIILELDGEQHRKFVPHFHGTRLKFTEQIKRDLMKEEFCERNNIDLVRIHKVSELNEQFFADLGVSL